MPPEQMLWAEDICDGWGHFWLLHVVPLSSRAAEVETWPGGAVCFGGDVPGLAGGLDVERKEAGSTTPGLWSEPQIEWGCRSPRRGQCGEAGWSKSSETLNF